MEDLIYQGKTLSFFDLIKEQKIEIPIIQRDYAQGRIDKKEIRQNFLNALFSSLNSNSKIELDFIYGSKIDGAFQPLDGQQRLTTLFLLYWYAANKENKLEDNKQILSRFTYETRISSREFCNALVNNSVDVKNDDDNLSLSIIDSNWFFLSWKKDPTIDSMLRTIDDIHLIFKGVNDLWLKLSSDKQLITFYYVELENIGLTDDLYIKMNARGRLLTSYENFKASFQKYVIENLWERDILFIDHFAFKIDTCWTDYFWQHFKKNSNIDEAFMRFISTIAMFRLAIERSSTKAEERAPIITYLQEQPNSVKPTSFSEDGFKYLIEYFEIYEKVLKNQTNLKLPFPLWRHKAKESILKEIVFEENSYSLFQSNSASYTQKVLFFAQTEYLRRNIDFNESRFQDWMRVVRNIVSRGDIDKDGMRPDIIRSPQTFDGVINLINELAEGCSDIYQSLYEKISFKSQFAKEQIEEEKKKTQIIINRPHLKEVVFEAEDNELLLGRIDFLFYCMGYDGVVTNFNEDLFIKLKDVFVNSFNSEDCLSNDLRRAFLTIEVDGKYEFYNYWWSYWNIIGATKRRLFDKFRELEYYIYSDYREYFKKVVLQLLDKELISIVNDFEIPEVFPNWKKRLIKEPNLLDKKSKSHYIAILEDNSSCYLLKSKRPRDKDGSYEVK